MQAQAKNLVRPMFLVVGDLINALGGYRVVAAACLVATDTVNKWKQDPTGNGQDIPVKHLQTLLTLVGENLTNLPAQNACDELLQFHFLGLCLRRAYLEERVFQMVELLT